MELLKVESIHGHGEQDTRADSKPDEPEGEPAGRKKEEGGEEASGRMVLSSIKLQILTLALCLSLFLSLLDTTIVSTALVRITSSLGGFERSSWVVNAYLLTYTGFLIISARLSDIFGRRAIVSLGIWIFIVSSIACAVAKTLNQLIIFRAFQGIGGGVMYTMTFVILPEMCTPDQYTLYSTIISCVATMSSLFGPIFGGLISQKTSWRWIFWLNVPTAVLCLPLLYFAIPSHFPFENKSLAPKISRQSLRKLDVLGAILMLGATTLFLTALEESGTSRSWGSPIVYGPLIAGVALYVAFVAWSRHQVSWPTVQEPLVPWHVLTDRFCLGIFAQSFWMATIMFSLTVTLPQRFQVVNQASALAAGYRLLPVTLVDPIGAVVGAYLLTARRIPALWLFLVGNCIQTLGVGLLIMQSRPHIAIWEPRNYFFECLTGFGLGWTSAVTILSVVLYFKPADVSVGMGGAAQFRSLGGAIGISITTNVLNGYTTRRLEKVLSPEMMEAIKGSAEAVGGFEESVQRAVRDVYAKGFKWQVVATTAFGGVGIVMLGLFVERKLRRMEKPDKKDGGVETKAESNKEVSNDP